MKKIIKLTESDLRRIVKRVISEQPDEFDFNNVVNIANLERKIRTDVSDIDDCTIDVYRKKFQAPTTLDVMSIKIGQKVRGKSGLQPLFKDFKNNIVQNQGLNPEELDIIQTFRKELESDGMELKDLNTKIFYDLKLEVIVDVSNISASDERFNNPQLIKKIMNLHNRDKAYVFTRDDDYASWKVVHGLSWNTPAQEVINCVRNKLLDNNLTVDIGGNTYEVLPNSIKIQNIYIPSLRNR